MSLANNPPLPILALVLSFRIFSLLFLHPPQSSPSSLRHKPLPSIYISAPRARTHSRITRHSPHPAERLGLSTARRDEHHIMFKANAEVLDLGWEGGSWRVCWEAC